MISLGAYFRFALELAGIGQGEIGNSALAWFKQLALPAIKTGAEVLASSWMLPLLKRPSNWALFFCTTIVAGGKIGRR